MKPQWWVNAGAYFGRTLTRFGAVTITVSPAGNRGGPVVAVEGAWHASPPRLDVRLPGYVPQSRPAAHAREEFNLESAS
jgi:hypothetical protein